MGTTAERKNKSDAAKERRSHRTDPFFLNRPLASMSFPRLITELPSEAFSARRARRGRDVGITNVSQNTPTRVVEWSRVV